MVMDDLIKFISSDSCNMISKPLTELEFNSWVDHYFIDYNEWGVWAD